MMLLVRLLGIPPRWYLLLVYACLCLAFLVGHGSQPIVSRSNYCLLGTDISIPHAAPAS